MHLNKKIVVSLSRCNARFATFLKITFRHTLYLMYVLCLHYSFTKNDVVQLKISSKTLENNSFSFDFFFSTHPV